MPEKPISVDIYVARGWANVERIHKMCIISGSDVLLWWLKKSSTFKIAMLARQEFCPYFSSLLLLLFRYMFDWKVKDTKGLECWIGVGMTINDFEHQTTCVRKVNHEQYVLLSIESPLYQTLNVPTVQYDLSSVDDYLLKLYT